VIRERPHQLDAIDIAECIDLTEQLIGSSGSIKIDFFNIKSISFSSTPAEEYVSLSHSQSFALAHWRTERYPHPAAAEHV